MSAKECAWQNLSELITRTPDEKEGSQSVRVGERGGTTDLAAGTPVGVHPSVKSAKQAMQFPTYHQLRRPSLGGLGLQVGLAARSASREALPNGESDAPEVRLNLAARPDRRNRLSNLAAAALMGCS
jgi:hypothetical protein